jgi:hypothetical protein
LHIDIWYVDTWQSIGGTYQVGNFTPRVLSRDQSVNRFEMSRGANVAVHPVISVADTPTVEENAWKLSSENEQSDA